METIDVTGLNKATVLVALYNTAKPQGMGFLHYDPTPMALDEAKEILSQTTDFDYLKGRVMKVDLSEDTFDPWLFDRDNGEGAAKRVIDSLRETNDPNNKTIQKKHSDNTYLSAIYTETHLKDKMKITTKGKHVEINLGLSDMEEFLQPKINKIKEKEIDK
ncbi:MAG: hypothetical protein K1000chlam3_01526 [Chlamydiae bacterium]|nr:hypothetical protein [Chlamydiota bacterium]